MHKLLMFYCHTVNVCTYAIHKALMFSCILTWLHIGLMSYVYAWTQVSWNIYRFRHSRFRITVAHSVTIFSRVGGRLMRASNVAKLS